MANKALANHFGGPGSIPTMHCSESALDREIFAPVPEAGLNGCKLHVKPYVNFLSYFYLTLRIKLA